MTMTLTLLTTSCLLLVTPLLLPLHTPHYIHWTLKLTKTACLLNVVSSLCFLSTGVPAMFIHIPLYPPMLNAAMGMMLDKYTALFMPTMMLITFFIMKFSTWYMSADPQLNKFIKYLLMFLMTMIILLTADNLFQLFIGWEGVGIMSFLLISWWHSRTTAITAGLQAVLYNRIGDMGFLISMAVIATTFKTWDLHLMFNHTQPPAIALAGLIVAAMAKSAQLGAHPWLLAAMEGPTPVSALLHSSTMVVAGVLLLVRFHPWLHHTPWALTLCLCLGAATALFAAKNALFQFDIKKIIALSTLSQLGLMVATIGLNQPTLALLHIVTHAFFKALLFLSAGSISHSLDGEQDIRKMGNLYMLLPITTSCMTLANLALAGTPFLTAFYSKDTILELMTTSMINAAALVTMLTATALTVAYSLRMTVYIHLHHPRYTPKRATFTLPSPLELNQHQITPLIWLALSSTFMGLVASTALVSYQQPTTMPLITKLLTITISTLTLILTLDIMKHALTPARPRPTIIKIAAALLEFFSTMLHRILPTMTFTHTQKPIVQLGEKFWLETLTAMIPHNLLTRARQHLKFLSLSTIKTYLIALTLFTLIALKFMF